MSDAVYSRCRQEGPSDRCELICRVSRRDRPESLSPVYLQVIPGLRMSNFGARCKLGNSLSPSRLSRRANSRKYMWLTWEMRKLAIAAPVSGLYVSAPRSRARRRVYRKRRRGTHRAARKNRIKLSTLTRAAANVYRCRTAPDRYYIS